jgi:hypothetical protein
MTCSTDLKLDNILFSVGPKGNRGVDEQLELEPAILDYEISTPDGTHPVFLSQQLRHDIPWNASAFVAEVLAFTIVDFGQFDVLPFLSYPSR